MRPLFWRIKLWLYLQLAWFCFIWLLSVTFAVLLVALVSRRINNND